MKKKFLSILLIFALLLTFSGCVTPTSSSELQILCTGFSAYDWVSQILNGTHHATVSLLGSNSADLHSYQATVADLAAISDCDLLVYIGGTSDTWVEEALKNPRNPNRKTLALLDLADRLDHEHSEGTEEHDHEDEEHVWLSIKYAIKAVDTIAQTMTEMDPANAEQYLANAQRYIQELQELDDRYQQCVDTAARKTLLFADRFPFRYLTEDYGLIYHAAFEGCSAEVEAGFSTIAFLAKKADELALPAILVIETGDQVIAQTVIDNTQTKNQQILILDSIQGNGKQRINSGMTYLGIMEQNLHVLQTALN